ncbi:MAG: glucuronate isomerase [Verrucomicrobia bacterium]|nr:glucuronate isomerase [Verrucomicrobiota bacterium]
MSTKRRAALAAQVEKTLANTPVYDIHTHLYDPAFGELLLWGIDDLLVYHYLVAEAFRQFDVPYDKFWAMSKQQQADVIWDTLFIQHSPISESCRGVLTTLNRLGLDVKKRDLPKLRKWFAKWNVADYTTHVMERAGVNRICMTNSPFDDIERAVWERGFERDPRFTAALRIDPLLLSWSDSAAPRLRDWGYNVTPELSEKTVKEVRRFLADWTRRIDAQYLMVSLPPDFIYPGNNSCARLMETAVLPHCREFGLPFAMMPGVKRGVNPLLKLAGDGVGLCDTASYESLIAAHPDNQFLITALARENQYSLCVAARKFRNLHLFGCWWFTNIPYLIEEMTRMRLELIGLSVTPQHSDARVLDQILYKWDHSRRLIAKVLTDKYADLAATGWEPTGAEIQRDVQDLFGGAFERFCGRHAARVAHASVRPPVKRGQRRV